MTNRRGFLRDVAGTTAGIVFTGCVWKEAAAFAMQSSGARRRREVVVGGRRVKTVDVHAHCNVPAVWDLVKDYEMGEQIQSQLNRPASGERVNVENAQARLRAMDEEGIDVQAVGVNPFWYEAERDLAAEIVRIQNEEIAKLCAAHPDRFVGLATIALQYPYLAAEQLEDGMKRLGMRGCLIAGSVNRQPLSHPRFRPFWAKAEQLGAFIFMHPRPTGIVSAIRDWLGGNGALTNVIGNPLETTVALSHMIFEGTLDRFPGLKICAAHAGGYLPSYIGRADRCVTQSPNPCTNVEPIQKRPSEYLKQLYFDSMVFTSEGLRHLVAESGASQVLMGTDFPYNWTSEAVDHILNTPGLSDGNKRAILGETAARLLHIES